METTPERKAGRSTLPVGSFTKREILFLLLLSLAAVAGLDLLFFRLTPDDAYITFRYSEHFSQGHGFGAWNIVGERVEGYTSWLWMVLLGLSHSLGFDIESASKVLGMVMHALLCSAFITFPLYRRRSDTSRNDIFDITNGVVLAGVLMASYLPLCWYAPSGMETILFSALVGLTFTSLYHRFTSVLTPPLVALLILARPEGVIVSIAAIVFDYILRNREGRHVRGVLVVALTAVVVVIALVIHRFAVFGDIVPNTYWAKAGGGGLRHVLFGIKYEWEWLATNGVIAFLCLLAVLIEGLLPFRARLRQWPLGLAVFFVFGIAYAAYVIKVGGDTFPFPFGRHFLHISPLFAVVACHGLVRLLPSARLVQIATLLIAATLANLSVLQANSAQMLKVVKESLLSYPVLSHDSDNEYFARLRQISDKNTVIASSAAGYLPYSVDAIHIDILGLNSRHIAKFGSFDPQGPIDSKTDMKWVLDQHPDIIEGYIPASILIGYDPEELERYINSDLLSMMHKGLVGSRAFQDEYLFVRKWPYEVVDRCLFVSKKYIAHIDSESVADLDCVPVSDTTLGAFFRKRQDTGRK